MLPEELFQPSSEWTVVGQGRCGHSDHITLGEARAVVRLCRRLLEDARAHHAAVISLQDNMPVRGSVSKGRSPAPQLNYLLRRKSAACLAADVKLIMPWVESSRQPADGLSRYVETVGEPQGGESTWPEEPRDSATPVGAPTLG